MELNILNSCKINLNKQSKVLSEVTNSKMLVTNSYTLSKLDEKYFLNCVIECLPSTITGLIHSRGYPFIPKRFGLIQLSPRL